MGMRSLSLVTMSMFFFLLVFLPGACFSDAIPDNAENYSSSAGFLGVIPSGSTSPFHQELLKSLNHTASERNQTVIMIPPDSEENITAQKQAMVTLINQKVRIICLNTLNTTALSPEVRAASAAGIPVLMYNTLTPAPDLNITEYIGYNQFTGAAELGSYAARTLAEKKNDAPETVQGKVFILRGLPGFHADQRTAGFITGLSQSPGLKIVGEQVAGWDRETAKKIAEQALKDYPGIDIFFGNSDEMAIGAAMAVQERGKKVTSDILCFGVDGNAPTLEMIRNGTMTATLGVYPDRMGSEIINQSEKILKGDQIPLYLETPSLVVDAQNLQAYLNSSSWTGAHESGPEKNAR